MATLDEQEPMAVVPDDRSHALDNLGVAGVSGVKEVRMYIFGHNAFFSTRRGNGAIQ
jgi:hypothetical protein